MISFDPLLTVFKCHEPEFIIMECTWAQIISYFTFALITGTFYLLEHKQLFLPHANVVIALVYC